MGYEKEVVQPAMAQWLTERGYFFKHEYDTGVGVIDFLVNRGGEKLIVECKGSSTNLNLSIMQVIYYCWVMGGSYSPMLCLPTHTVTDRVREKLKRVRVDLIELDLVSKDSRYNPLSRENLTSAFRYAYTQAEIWHKEFNTSPYGDMLLIASMYQCAIPTEREEILQDWVDWLIGWVDTPSDYIPYQLTQTWFGSDGFYGWLKTYRIASICDFKSISVLSGIEVLPPQFM